MLEWSAMGVYLEDHPPARAQYVSPRKAKVTGAIVVHTAESAPDLSGPDSGAEGVARFISTRSDPGSYHSIVDSDSVVRVGKYEWQMFGEGTGGNKFALHLSFATHADKWATIDLNWAAAAIRNGAREARAMADWVQATTGIVVPARRITAQEYFAGKPGFIAHATLDPKRRTDPGANFPWGVFLDEFAATGKISAPATPSNQAPTGDDEMADAQLTARVQQLEWMVDIAFNVLPYADSAFDLVTGLYRIILGREPDDGGLLYWTRQVEKGVPIGDVVKAFIDAKNKETKR